MSDGIWPGDRRIQLERGEFLKGRAIPSGRWEAGQSVNEGFGWVLEGAIGGSWWNMG